MKNPWGARSVDKLARSFEVLMSLEQRWLPSRAMFTNTCSRTVLASPERAEQPSVIGNLIEQSLLLARKTWPMLVGIREPVRGPVKGKRNQS